MPQKLAPVPLLHADFQRRLTAIQPALRDHRTRLVKARTQPPFRWRELYVMVNHVLRQAFSHGVVEQFQPFPGHGRKPNAHGPTLLITLQPGRGVLHAINLVTDLEHGNVISPDVRQNRLDLVYGVVALRIRVVDDMQEDRCLNRLLKGRPERLDKSVRQMDE